MFLSETLWVWMLLALGVTLFSGLPVGVVLAGIGLLFGGIGWAADLVRPSDFAMIYYRMYGTLKNSSDAMWSGVPLLLMMGLLLLHSGVADEMLRSLQHLLRRVPAGLAIAVTIIGVILAPAAGMVGASVVMLALITLPIMLEQGYRPGFAAGSVAAAGALGVALPPGVMLFFLSESMGIFSPYVFLAMVGPSLLLIVLYCTFCGVSGWLQPPAAPPPSTAASAVSARVILSSLALPVGLTIAVLLLVTVGWVPLSESASVGACGAFVICLVRRKFSIRLLHQVIRETTVLSAMVFFIYIGACVFNLIFWLIGGPTAVGNLIDQMQLGSWGTLMLILSVLFLLGFIIDWIELVVVSFVIFRPAIDSLDFTGTIQQPVLALAWVTVLIALTLQSSFLTPPFGYALLFLRGSAPKSVRTIDIYKGIIPFVIIQVFALTCVATFPKIATWLPGQVFSDGPRKTAGHGKV